MWKHIVAYFYLVSIQKFANCCNCDFNHTDGGGIEKRQLEESTTELFEKTTETSDLTDSSLYMSVTTIPHIMFFETNETTSITESGEVEANKSQTVFDDNNKIDNIYDFSENSSEIVEFSGTVNTIETISDVGKTDFKETTTESVKKIETKPSKELWKRCRQYKNGDSFELAKMADVWQVVYYRLANKLKCFKLHIKQVTPKDQRRYARVYGNFNETVFWNRCFLEITSSEKDHKGRKHFLQGTQADRGIMENVIIDEEYCKNTTYLTLHRESGDQWLVIGKLLLMRDCQNGDFVVFTRVPLQPRKIDIMDALKKFGVNHPNGTMACNVEKSWLKYEEGSY